MIVRQAEAESEVSDEGAAAPVSAETHYVLRDLFGPALLRRTAWRWSLGTVSSS